MRRERDLLHDAVVCSAVVLVAIVLWVGGRRALARRGAGRPGPVAVEPPRPADDGVDHAPPVIPPLVLSGVKGGKPPKKRASQPAARPLPPITPDKE